MSVPLYKKAEARQKAPYQAADGAMLAEPPEALETTQQTLTMDDMGFRTRPQVVVWLPIEDAPQDGRALMLKASLDTEGPGTPAVWHRTRRWSNGKWEQVAYWADPVHKWRLRFDAKYWRRPVYGLGIAVQ